MNPINSFQLRVNRFQQHLRLFPQAMQKLNFPLRLPKALRACKLFPALLVVDIIGVFIVRVQHSTVPFALDGSRRTTFALSFPYYLKGRLRVVASVFFSFSCPVPTFASSTTVPKPPRPLPFRPVPLRAS